ncbi:hypothetical protein BDZ85DRAFT_111246 [Elsinoe ampelina]|uniref:K Homology domain-containing protein n=1 Tax=Elsinoe ampelina TaxID=302913 RepID=A0A6A6GCV4_9PEZI|nr:hypothetical protein BDZ85DRAFT_111246 [Elsinoe ampelina]
MSDGSRKRSRFDQKEPAKEPATQDPRRSRFDRRSRSPAAKDESSRKRSRSPAARKESPERKKATPVNPVAAAAAAAMAAKINAELEQKKKLGLISQPQVKTQLPKTQSPAPNTDANGLNLDIYEQDGDWIKDIEVNDLRNRYTLTKGQTQKMIKEKTGADVTTRGAYYPDKAMATAAAPPLYLHITSTSKEGLEAAVKEIEEMMKQDLPNLIDERRLPRRREPDFERDERGRRKWPEERIPISLEPINGFNLRAQVVGSGGSYVKHIQGETGARVQIKGRGSGFYEHDTGVESDEPMYLHVAAPDPAQVAKAKDLCNDLLANVKVQYEEFKERANSRGFGGRGGYGGGGRGGFGGDDRGRSESYGGGGQSAYGGGSQYGGNSQYGGQSAYGGYGGAQSPTNPQAGGAMSPTAASGYDANQRAQWDAYLAQIAQQYPGYDPYQVYLSMMAQYPQGQAQGQAAYSGQEASPAQGYGQAPPPPPPADDSAPPPPPPGAGAPGYNAVPPPPGM